MNNKNTITLNGKISTQIPGLLIQELPPISKPLLRAEKEEIDGRDGDIITPLGYSSYNKEITIGLYGNYDIDQVIAYFNGEGTVIFSNEPDKYYNYQILEQIDFERLVRYKTATVTFHVQPFKYAAFEGDLILDPPADNLITIPDYSNTTNGVTVTAAGESVTITGKATTVTEVYLPIQSLSLDAGTYLLSATSSGTNPSSSSVRLIGSAPSNVDSLGGKYITLDEGTVTLQGALPASKTFNYIWFYINAGQTLNFSTTFELENQAQKVASGEGTSLALVGTSEAPFSRFDIKGDTYQQTYSGANLYNFSDTFDVGSGTTVTDDGFITMTGGNPASSTTNVYKNYFTNNLDLQTSSDYVVVVEVKSVSGTGKLVVCSSNQLAIGYSQVAQTRVVDFSSLTAGSIRVFSVTTRESFLSPGVGIRTYLQFRPGESGSITFRISVLVDTSVTPETFVYEPYVGGIPSPSPDYPQEPQTVKYQAMLRLTGKNLANADELYLPADVVRTEDGLQDTIESSTLTTYYSASSANPVGVYTVSFDAKIQNPDEAVCVLGSVAGIFGQDNLVLKNSDGEAADENDRMLTEEWKRFNFTVIATTSEIWTPERAMTLYFSTYTNSPVFELRNLQMEYGIAATDFDESDTQMYPIDFRIGKNMLSVDFLSMGGLTDGNPVSSVKYRVQNSTAPLGAMPNTPYTISAVLGSTVKGMMVQVQECDANTLFLRSSDWQQLAGGAYTFTTGSDTQILKLVFALSTTNTTVIENSTENTTEFDSPEEWLRGATIQVEAGDTATTYEDYESMELCKIGNYQDYITKSGDDWYLHKEVGKVELDGTENWVFRPNEDPFYYSLTLNVGQQTSDGKLFVSHYFLPTVSWAQRKVGAWFDSNLIIKTKGSLDNTQSLEDFKAWLSNNKPVFYFALATPTDIQITSPSAIAYLENLINHVHAYKDMTYISSLLAVPSSLPPIVGAEVLMSSDGVVTNAGNFPAKPKLTIYGTGNIGVSLNGIQMFEIALGDEGHITIDTAAMEAYQDTTDNLKNRLVVGDYDNFMLNTGENSITFTGTVTKCIVENYSRWL